MSIFDRLDRTKINSELKTIRGYFKSDERLCARCSLPMEDNEPDWMVFHEHPEQCILALSDALLAALKTQAELTTEIKRLQAEGNYWHTGVLHGK